MLDSMQFGFQHHKLVFVMTQWRLVVLLVRPSMIMHKWLVELHEHGIVVGSIEGQIAHSVYFIILVVAVDTITHLLLHLVEVSLYLQLQVVLAQDHHLQLLLMLIVRLV